MSVRAWRCSFHTFGLEADPEYRVEEVTPIEHYDPHFTEVLYRVMKGLAATAVIFADEPPTKEAFEREVQERMAVRLAEITRHVDID